MRLDRGARQTERLTLDAPGAHVDQQRRARKTAARCARRHPAPDGRSRPGDRRSPVLRASRRRSDWHRRRVLLLRHRPARPNGRRQHHHPAARPQRLPAEVRRDDARKRALAIAAAEGPRDFRVGHPDHPRVEGRDPRDVPERRPARTARLVRDSGRQRGVAAVFRQGRQQRLARRSGDDCRRHSIALGAVALQQPGAVPRAPQRRAVGDGRCRLCRGAAGRPRRPGTAHHRPARARGGGPVLRGLHRPGARRPVSRADHDHRQGRGRPHDARSPPAAAGAGRRADRADQGRSAAVAAEAQGQGRGGAHRRRSAHRRDSGVRRRPLV